MKVQFEPKERQILAGLLAVVQTAAIDDIEQLTEVNAHKDLIINKKKLLKDINRLMWKFRGDSSYVSIKRAYLDSISQILTTVVTETTFDKLKKNEKAKMNKEDYDVCVSALSKVEGFLEKS